MEIVLREQVDVVDKFFIGRQLLLTSEIANCFNNSTFFSLFLDPAVEASFTHKGVRYYLYICRVEVGITGSFSKDFFSQGAVN